MKRFSLWALVALCLSVALVSGVAMAQVPGEIPADVNLIFVLATSAAGVIAGWLFKQSPVPNGFIPAVMGVIAVVAMVLLTDMSFKQAVWAAMAVVGGSVTIYETGKAAIPKPTGGE